MSTAPSIELDCTPYIKGNMLSQQSIQWKFIQMHDSAKIARSKYIVSDQKMYTWII